MKVSEKHVYKLVELRPELERKILDSTKSEFIEYLRDNATLETYHGEPDLEYTYDCGKYIKGYVYTFSDYKSFVVSTDNTRVWWWRTVIEKIELFDELPMVYAHRIIELNGEVMYMGGVQCPTMHAIIVYSRFEDLRKFIKEAQNLGCKQTNDFDWKSFPALYENAKCLFTRLATRQVYINEKQEVL
jgi:hypothetical protein